MSSDIDSHISHLLGLLVDPTLSPEQVERLQGRINYLNSIKGLM
jgi:hypothetical protein